MGFDIQHQAQQHRFVTRVDGSEAYLSYRPAGEGTLDFTSTFVPPAARGKGLGGEIVRHALDYARDHGYRVIPTCPFVSTYIEEHPEYRELTG